MPRAAARRSVSGVTEVALRRTVARLNRAPIVDAVIALLLTGLTQAQLDADVSVAARLLLAGASAAVAVRRRNALLVAVAVAVLLGLMGLTRNPPSVFGEYLTVLLAGYTVAERCTLPFAIAGGLALAAGVIAHDLASSQYDSPSGIVSDLMIPIVIWVVGRVVYFQRSRADRSRRLVRRMEAERDELARVAVDLERAHLARELHDVVTHSVSVVVIQAQGAQRVLDGEQQAVRDALASIESAGRSALTEMRRLLGVMREDEQRHGHSDQPGLAEVETLVGKVRSTGLDVELATEGAAPSGVVASLPLTVYRLVQEALTNALKYAPAGRVMIRLRYQQDEIGVDIASTGADGQHPTGTGSGRGLLGMRERVSAQGGTLEAGPTPDGGFHVRASLPVKVPGE